MDDHLLLGDESMAKTNELPSMRSQPKEPPRSAEKKAPSDRECDELTLSLPVHAWTSGYAKQRHEIRLNTEQSRALRSIVDGLQKNYKTLRNGRQVSNSTDAIRWILEHVADMTKNGFSE